MRLPRPWGVSPSPSPDWFPEFGGYGLIYKFLVCFCTYNCMWAHDFISLLFVNSKCSQSSGLLFIVL